jgi:hypothetical protein
MKSALQKQTMVALFFYVSKFQTVRKIQPVTAPLNLSMQRTARPCGHFYPTWLESHGAFMVIFGPALWVPGRVGSEKPRTQDSINQFHDKTAKITMKRFLSRMMQQTITSAKQNPYCHMGIFYMHVPQFAIAP